MKSISYFKLVMCFCVLGTLFINSSGGISTSARCGTWSIVKSPNVGGTNVLYDVTAISTNDVWAVGGYHRRRFSFPSKTLIERWNGSKWSIIPSPSPSTDSVLWGVAAVSPNDIWAVGNSYTATGLGNTLIEHWDGANWSVVPSPSRPSLDNQLYQVTAISSNDVWTVGLTTNGVGVQSLIEHWDGKHWSIVPHPLDGGFSGVASVSANDIWAVGGGSNYSGLTEHWDGKKWSITPNPSPRGTLSLWGVTIISSKDVWTVGTFLKYDTHGYFVDSTLTEHWDGVQWGLVPSPNIGRDFLFGVAAISSSNVWAVGDTDVYPGTLTEHWNGSNWSIVKDPNPGYGGSLHAVTSVPGTSQAWTVGAYADKNNNTLTLTEFLSC